MSDELIDFSDLGASVYSNNDWLDVLARYRYFMAFIMKLCFVIGATKRAKNIVIKM